MLKELKVLWTIIRTVLTIVLVALLAIILTQRVSNNKKAILGLRIFNVATESMVPEYLVGDAIITAATDPAKIKIGDDVTYLGTEDTFKDRIVTHRVINIERDENGKYIFQTQGIANEEEDPKINETQIFGKVAYKIKSISYLNGIIGNLYGMYFVIVVPFALMIFFELVVFRKSDEEDDDDDNHDDKTESNNKENEDKLEKRKKRRNKRRQKRKDKKEI